MAGSNFRSIIKLAEILVCLSGIAVALVAVPAGIGHEFSTWTGVAKCTTIACILFFSTWGIRNTRARLISSIIFSILAAYNFGQFLAEKSDCGCFPIPVRPLTTMILDSLLSVCFAFTSKDQICALRLRPSAIPILVMVLLVVLAVWLGYNQIFSDAMTVGNPTFAAREDTCNRRLCVGDRLLKNESQPTTIIFVRSDCPRCNSISPLLRMQIQHNAQYIGRKIELRLDMKRAIDLEFGVNTSSIEFNELINRFAYLPVPQIAQIENGIVVGVEDYSQKRK